MHQYGIFYLHSALEGFGGVPMEDFPASYGAVFLFIDLSGPADGPIAIRETELELP